VAAELGPSTTEAPLRVCYLVCRKGIAAHRLLGWYESEDLARARVARRQAEPDGVGPPVLLIVAPPSIATAPEVDAPAQPPHGATTDRAAPPARDGITRAG
jgi:hypothetical protein